MPLRVPTARRPLKLEVPATILTDLTVIAERHYEKHQASYEEAKADKPTAAEVAADLLEDAIRRELRPPRNSKK